MPGIYNSNQITELLRRLKFRKIRPRWLVCAGLGYGDELQRFQAFYPDAQSIGVEPVTRCLEFQGQQGIPARSEVYQAVLGSNQGNRLIRIVEGAEQRSSVVRDVPGDPVPIDCITIDGLDVIHGPFEHGILWLDVEGMEFEALRGATGCLTRQAFDVLNIEHNPTERPGQLEEMGRFLRRYKYRPYYDWNESGDHFDRVYLLSTIGTRR